MKERGFELSLEGELGLFIRQQHGEGGGGAWLEGRAAESNMWRPEGARCVWDGDGPDYRCEGGVLWGVPEK